MTWEGNPNAETKLPHTRRSPEEESTFAQASSTRTQAKTPFRFTQFHSISMKLMIDQSLNLCESDDRSLNLYETEDQWIDQVDCNRVWRSYVHSTTDFQILQVSKKTNRKEEKEAEEGRLDRCKGRTCDVCQTWNDTNKYRKPKNPNSTTKLAS